MLSWSKGGCCCILFENVRTSWLNILKMQHGSWVLIFNISYSLFAQFTSPKVFFFQIRNAGMTCLEICGRFIPWHAISLIMIDCKPRIVADISLKYTCILVPYYTYSYCRGSLQIILLWYVLLRQKWCLNKGSWTQFSLTIRVLRALRFSLLGGFNVVGWLLKQT